MSLFDADSRLPFSSGILAIIVSAAGAIAAVAGAFLSPVSAITFLFVLAALGLGVLALWLGWQLYGYMTASYAIDRNAFVIRWGLMREIIPMGNVQRVIAASDLEKGLTLRRIPLSGWWRGVGSHPALGAVHFYATEALARQIVIVTPDRNFVVSPYDREAFLDAFRARIELKPTQPVLYSRVMPGLLSWEFWEDRVAHFLLFLAFLINLGLFGIGLSRYPSAPVQVPLHFDAVGLPDRFGPRSQLFAPAYVALALMIVCVALGAVLYARKDRYLAYLLWGGSVVIQALFVVSMITIAFAAL